MDKYKKKNLKFSGYSKEIRAAELNSFRSSFRFQRYSLLRDLSPCRDVPDEPPSEVEIVIEKPVKTKSNIPILSKNTIPQPTMRTQMLKKWKEEKELKKQRELLNKKPVFKFGTVSNQPGYLDNKKLTEAQKSKDSSKILFKKPIGSFSDNKQNSSSKIVFKKPIGSFIDNKQIPAPLQESKISSQNHVRVKGPTSRLPKALVKSVNSSKEAKVSDKVFKIPAKVTEKKLPIHNLEVKKTATHSSTSLLKNINTSEKVTEKPKILKREPIPRAVKVPVITLKKHAKPVLLFPKQNEVSVEKKNSDAVSLNSSKMGNTESLVKKTDSSKVENADTSAVKNADSFTVTNVDSSSVENADSSTVKNAGSAAVKIGDLSAVRNADSSIIENSSSSVIESQPEVTIECKEPKDFAFQCELSLIEPLSAKKSFAPRNFMFSPPHGLNLFTDCDASTIFSREKLQHERTSTPKHKFLDIFTTEENKKCSPKNYTSEIYTNDSIFRKTEELQSGIICSTDLKNLTCNSNSSPLFSKDVPHIPVKQESGDVVINKPNIERIDNDCLEADSPKSTRVPVPRYFSSFGEDIFTVTQPSYFISSTEGEVDDINMNKPQTTLTDDFQKLELKTVASNQINIASNSIPHRTPANSNKISLLFTPPKNTEIDMLKRSSAANDLISFSPEPEKFRYFLRHTPARVDRSSLPKK